MARTDEQPTAARVRNLARPLQVIARRQTGRSPVPERSTGNRRELEHNGLRWIDIQRPTRADVDSLGLQFDFHPLVLDDVLSRVQRPKLDDYERYLFLVLQFPRFNPREGIAVASEVDFFLGADYVVTVHDGELPPLLNFWALLDEHPDSRAEYMGAGAELLLYHILDRLTNYLFPMMTRIDQNIDQLDARIFKGNASRAVRDLSDYRRDLISLRRIIRPDMLVVSTLENGRASGLSEDLQPYWSDISDHLTRVWDMLTEFKEELEGLDDTFNTLYSYRTTETLRALTLISVILLPLTLISGIYGMNLKLPFDNHPGSLGPFFGIVGTMVVMATVMLVFFRRKGWW
jgi:magnesium transporter